MTCRCYAETLRARERLALVNATKVHSRHECVRVFPAQSFSAIAMLQGGRILMNGAPFFLLTFGVSAHATKTGRLKYARGCRDGAVLGVAPRWQARRRPGQCECDSDLWARRARARVMHQL
eukprot:1733462-Rhodomonas_salina.2